MLNNWRRSTFTPPPQPSGTRRWRQTLIEEYGTPEQNPTFWNSISSNTFLSDVSGPIQLHHGTNDASVPFEFSTSLERQMKNAEKEVELYIYSGDDHNLSQSFSIAMRRSIDFFNTYVKNIKN
jgi:dipeptidyl aminopeptidase/acylaminoacyl peptidase